MENLSENKYLNLHSLIKEQPTFWQTCFDKPFEENGTIEKLRNAMDKGSDNVGMLSEDDEVFLREIFVVKASLDGVEQIKQNENEAKEVFDIRRNTAVDNILLTKIVPLIERTFPIDEQFTGEDRQNLINKLTSYTHRNYLPLLNLYLQFLVRNKFFENNETKINLFSAFHNEIEACEGGMINRLYQYVGSNNIAQIIEKDLNLAIERFVAPGDQVHVLGFIQKYLFGQKSEDPMAINIVRYLSSPTLEKLCIKVLKGDFTENLFRAEIANYLKTILTVNDEELKNRFGEENKSALITITNENNSYIKDLKGLVVDFANKISNNSNSKEKVNPSDYSKIFDVPEALQEIFLDDEYNFIKDEERGKLIKQGGLNAIMQEASKGIIDKIKDNTSKLPYAQDTIVITEDKRNKLNILGELYSVFLGKLTYLTEKQFVEKLLLVKELFDEKIIEEGKVGFFLKENLDIPEEIKNYINYNLDELLIDKNFNLNPKRKETSFLKNIISQLQNNDLVLNSNLTNENPLALTGKIEEACQLYALLFNSTSNYKSIQDLKGKLTLTISDILHIAELRRFLSPEQFLGLLKNDILIISSTINAEVGAAVINLYGNLLIKELPEQCDKLFNKLSENKPSLFKVLNGGFGQFLTKDYPDYFLKILNKEEESFIYEVLNKSNTGLKFAASHPGKFIGLLNLINNDSRISEIICGNTGKILAEKDPNDFAEFLKEKFTKILPALFPTILQSQSIKILAENHQDGFVPIFDKMIGGLLDSNNIGCFPNVLTGNLGKVLAEKYPEQFAGLVGIIENKASSEIDSRSIIHGILKSESGQILAEKHPEHFIKSLNCITDKSYIFSIILGDGGKILAEKHPEQFIKLLFDKFKPNNKSSDFYDILQSKSGVALAASAPKKIFDILDTIKNSDKFPSIIEKVGGVLFKNNKEKFIEIFRNIESESCISELLAGEVGVNLLENDKYLFNQFAHKIKEDVYIQSVLEGKSGELLFSVDKDMFSELSEKLVKSMKVSSLYLGKKLGEILAENFPDQFVEAVLSRKDKNDTLEILKLESGRILAERYPDHFIKVLNNVLDNDQADNKNVKIKTKPLKDVLQSEAFKALVDNNKGNETIKDEVGIIVGKIISKGFGVTTKFINEIDFIKENNWDIEKPKTRAKPKPENTKQLNRKKEREEDNNQDGKRNLGRD